MILNKVVVRIVSSLVMLAFLSGVAQTASARIAYGACTINYKGGAKARAQIGINYGAGKSKGKSGIRHIDVTLKMTKRIHRDDTPDSAGTGAIGLSPDGRNRSWTYRYKEDKNRNGITHRKRLYVDVPSNVPVTIHSKLKGHTFGSSCTKWFSL